MTLILDLPEEIILLIAEHLNARAIYACIRTCRSFYYSFVPRLWCDLNVKQYKREPIDADFVRDKVHLIEAINYSTTLTDDYYTIIYPRLHTLRLDTFYADEKEPNYLQTKPPKKVEFARHHPTIRKLIYHHKDSIPRQFWEVIESYWTDFESLEVSGSVEADAVDIFWKVCDRLQTLYFSDLNLPESMPVLSTLSFQHLQDLRVKKYPWHRLPIPHRRWPVQLLEQVKKSERLRRLAWDVHDVAFPARMIMDIFAEDCWPNLHQLSIGDATCSDQDLAGVLRAITSRKLTAFEYVNGKFGPLTYKCLQDRYFGHLQDLNIGRCIGVTSTMVQEILMECTQLIDFDAPHVFVQDIVQAEKPWGCLKIQTLVVYIVKQPDDKPGWDGRVFEQISKLRRVCRSFYSAYIPCLWSNVCVKSYKGEAISADLLRANAHHIETLTLSPSLTPEHYTIVFPRLRCIWILTYYRDKKDSRYLQVQPHHMVQFARLHSSIRELGYDQIYLLSKGFWEVVESEWKEFESLELSGTVNEDLGEASGRCVVESVLFASLVSYFPKTSPSYRQSASQTFRD
ncbi:hypothetical protein BGZ96_006062 [Linnemannia gamsii]|uniref:F-box domain-containing protein n=1 Tax=Linnemannia gamsii TaxID=64522 RepID=A0ABQ7K4D9_9FUNG|nr:hypothetical protein BGZ96_006062 [Linnemannia gamsii]